MHGSRGVYARVPSAPVDLRESLPSKGPPNPPLVTPPCMPLHVVLWGLSSLEASEQLRPPSAGDCRYNIQRMYKADQRAIYFTMQAVAFGVDMVVVKCRSVAVGSWECAECRLIVASGLPCFMGDVLAAGPARGVSLRGPYVLHAAPLCAAQCSVLYTAPVLCQHTFYPCTIISSSKCEQRPPPAASVLN